MIYITLDDQQASVLESKPEFVEVRSSDGKLLGYLTPADSEEAILAEAKSRRSRPGMRFTTEEVLGRLRDLETQ
jgi:hypothetical protein